MTHVFINEKPLCLWMIVDDWFCRSSYPKMSLTAYRLIAEHASFTLQYSMNQERKKKESKETPSSR